MKHPLLRFFLALLMLVAPSLWAADFVVINTADSGPGSLRQAINDAIATSEADTIRFAASLSGEEIKLTSGPLLILAPAIPAAIRIDGGALIDPVTLTRDWESQSRLFEIEEGAELTLVGLKLEDGYAPDGANGSDGAAPSAGTGGGDGGAIHNQGILTVVRCLFKWNIAGRGGDGGKKSGSDPGVSGAGGRGGRGGAIFSTGVNAVVRLESTTLLQNDAGDGGAAGYRENGATGTIGSAGKGGSGGAVYVDGGVLEVDLSNFEYNKAGLGGSGGISEGGGLSGQGGEGGDGGAIAFFDAALAVTNSTFQGNRAGAGVSGGEEVDGSDFHGDGGHGGDGGAIWGFHFSSVVPQVSGCYFELNYAGDGARGGDVKPPGDVEIEGDGGDGGNGGNGGGLFLVGKPGENAIWTMTNSTLYRNSSGDGGRGGDGSASGTGGRSGDAGMGGGIAFSKDEEGEYTALLSHVTIYNNYTGFVWHESSPPGGGVGSESSGGGIWEYPGGINGAPGVTLANSVVALNSAEMHPNIAPGFAEAGVNFTSGIPQLGIPSDNGGPTLTIAPLRESVLVNGGGELTTPLLTDQRGAVRPFNGVPDIGAFEVALQPDLRIGLSSNPATHHINNYYTSTGIGQLQALKLKKMKRRHFYLSVQNDGEIADDLTLSGTAANRSIRLTALRLTGGPVNVTAELTRGYQLANLMPDELSVFQISVKARKKKKRARQTLYYSVRTVGVPLPDTVLAKVTQKKVKKKKKRK